MRLGVAAGRGGWGGFGRHTCSYGKVPRSPQRIWDMSKPTQTACAWCGRSMEVKPGAFPICDPCADQVIAPLPSRTPEAEPAAAGESDDTP